MKLSSFLALAATASAALSLAHSASAGEFSYRISVNTTSLVSNANGPFYLDFQLNDGSGLGDANNWATLSNFSFGGGWASGSPTAFGGAWGNLSSSVQLNDSSAFNELYQGFNPGSWLTFDLNLTTNLDDGGTPDLFSFTILDSVLANIPTLSGGSDSLLTVNLDRSVPAVWSFASNPDIAPAAGGPALSLAAPSFAAIPEPSTYGLFAACALLGLASWRRRKKN